jgi:hypothetical protein
VVLSYVASVHFEWVSSAERAHGTGGRCEAQKYLVTPAGNITLEVQTEARQCII